MWRASETLAAMSDRLSLIPGIHMIGEPTHSSSLTSTHLLWHVCTCTHTKVYMHVRVGECIDTQMTFR